MDIKTVHRHVGKSLSEAIQDFLFHCQYEKSLNDKTLKAYKVDLRQFDEYLVNTLDKRKMEDISKEMVRSYLQCISNFKPKTIKRKIASLKALLNYYEFENDDYINPFRKMSIHLKEPYVLPIVMNADEVEAILSQLYKERSLNADIDKYSYKAQTRNIAIIELLFATGIRVSELCLLKCDDVDYIHGYIKIWGKGSKERLVQICSKDVLSILKCYSQLFQPKDYFFVNRLGNVISSQSVRLLVKRYVNSLNLSKHITPHTFRHTFATLLLEEDVDIKYIQNLLGHSSIVTTQIYTHVNTNKLKEILSTKHPREKINIDL